MHIMLFSCQHYDQDSFLAANAAGAFTLSFQPSRLTLATAALADGVTAFVVLAPSEAAEVRAPRRRAVRTAPADAQRSEVQ